MVVYLNISLKMRFVREAKENNYKQSLLAYMIIANAHNLAFVHQALNKASYFV